MFRWDREPGGRRWVLPHGSGQLGSANVHVTLQWLCIVQHQRGPGREGTWTCNGTFNGTLKPACFSLHNPSHLIARFIISCWAWTSTQTSHSLQSARSRATPLHLRRRWTWSRVRRINDCHNSLLLDLISAAAKEMKKQDRTRSFYILWFWFSFGISEHNLFLLKRITSANNS